MTEVSKEESTQAKEPANPLQVRKTTSEVVQNLQLLQIHQAKLKAITQTLRARIKAQKLLTETQFGRIQITPQRIFIQDAINFCFWAKKGEPKWAVEYPKGEIQDGWNALVASFDRALKEGTPLLETDYIVTVTQADTRHIFRSTNETEIPLLAQRTAILRETGKILQKEFKGNIENLVSRAGHDAAKIADSAIEHFPSFNDMSRLAGRKVYFFKRAQIFAYDLSLLKGINISNIESLTAFADYKLPQLLRSLGIIQYKTPLASKVDTMTVLPKGSVEEIEIRAATIWVCDQIAKLLEVPAVKVDNALWLLSQEAEAKMKPYHRTLTTCY